MTLERNVPIPRCPRGRSDGRSRPSTSWRSWPSTTPRRRARRGRCCAARACTPAISWSGARRAMRARWPGSPVRRGRKRRARQPEKIARLEAEKRQLEQELAKARFVVDVQAKLHALLETLSESADTEPRSEEH